MPYLSFTLSAELSREQSDRLAGILTELTASVLGKKPELTSVRIGSAAAESWYVGARSMSSQDQVTFHLDIKVTRGTNTKREKSDYIRQVFDAVAGLFGPLAPASYVVIHEVDADAWGYEGRTQEYRSIQGAAL